MSKASIRESGERWAGGGTPRYWRTDGETVITDLSFSPMNRQFGYDVVNELRGIVDARSAAPGRRVRLSKSIR